MKRIIALVLVTLLMTFCFVSCNKADDSVSSVLTEYTTEKTTINNPTYPVVKMTIKDFGDITIKLDDAQAPITVANFVKLVNEGFYDGIGFHRITTASSGISVLQGGDPDGTGAGGSDETIKGEFAANGVNNTISHVRGVISMARSEGFDSASSQFFICYADDCTVLDGQYAGFGMITDGMDVVDKIVKKCAPTDGSEIVALDTRPVIEKAVVVE